MKEMPPKVLAQNVFSLRKPDEKLKMGPGSPLIGANTGQDSFFEIHRAGATGSLLGHSEVREVFGITNIDVRNSFIGMRLSGLEPIVCIGESFDDRYPTGTKDNEDREAATSFVKNQIRTIFGDLPNSSMPASAVKDMTLAYEPRWAINTGVSATPEQVNEMHNAIYSTLDEMFGEEVAKSVRLLYGGSANPKNTTELFKLKNVHGFLVGTASANPDDFAEMGKQMVDVLDSYPYVEDEKRGFIPVLAGNFKDMQHDSDTNIAARYGNVLAPYSDRLETILIPPNSRIREFSQELRATNETK